MIKFILSLLLVGNNTFAATATTVAASGDPVVAVVNGVEIHKLQLEQAYNQSLLAVTNRQVTKERVLNEIINREIGIKKAKEAKLDQDHIVKAKMEDVLYHAKISQDLEKKLVGLNVTDKEAQEYYVKNKEYRTAHILLRVKLDAKKDENEGSMVLALDLYKKLQKNPNEWQALVEKYSQSSTAIAGGDLGFVPAVNYAPEYYKAIAGHPVGFITSPVRTQFGLHIIKILGMKEWKDADPGLYKKIVYDMKRDKIMDDYFLAERKSAQIKINTEILKQ